MSIAENLKKTIDDLRIDERVDALAQDLDRVYAQTMQSVGGYVSSREEHINGLIEKVASTLDTRTEGRFSGEITKVAGTVHRGVTKLAAQDDPTPDDPTPGA
jgi:hypothetical protein